MKMIFQKKNLIKNDYFKKKFKNKMYFLIKNTKFKINFIFKILIFLNIK